MRNILKYITLIVISGLFMISATGVYFTVHHCTSENFTLLFLFTPADGYCEHQCTGHHTDSSPGDSCDPGLEHDAEGHCSCPAPGALDCCSDTVLYIDVDDDFVRTEPPGIHVSNTNLPPASGFNLISTFGNDRNLHPCRNPLPPGRLHGKMLAFSNHQLLL